MCTAWPTRSIIDYKRHRFLRRYIVLNDRMYTTTILLKKIMIMYIKECNQQLINILINGWNTDGMS